MITEQHGGALCWYAIHTKPKQERRAELNLRAWNIEALAPKIRARRRGRSRGGSLYVEKPLFPRYLFARFDVKTYLHRVIFTRGVQNIVRFGDAPIPVDDQIIAIIQLRVGVDGFVQMREEFKCGDRVMIQEGPFQSLVGIFEGEVDEAERIRILLTAISYQAHITIEKDLVRKMPPEGGANQRALVGRALAADNSRW
ncbi:MAG TPA: transcription termination/antitermination NusG family protein [Pyrinomonadaceae bacterium]|jgi:transcriptional antiterminator RfaH